jgi:hypothetical protein
MKPVMPKNDFRPGHDQVQEVRSETLMIIHQYEMGEVGEAIKTLERIMNIMIKASTESVEDYDARKGYVGKGKGVSAAVADLQRNFGR